MTFVTVGNGTSGFDRLLREVGRLAVAGILPGPVIVQSGTSTHRPERCDTTPFVSREAFRDLVESADLVVTHGGAGSIGMCLRLGRKPIVVPRLRSYGEVVNDHQLELVDELERQGRIFAVRRIVDLERVVLEAVEGGIAQPVREEGIFLKKAISDFLFAIEGRRG